MKRGCCSVFLVILVLAGVYAWNLFVSVPVKISPETTIFTKPRTSDRRYVDYFAILEANYPAEMKTDKNSARGILRRLGPGSALEGNLSWIHTESIFDYGREATEAEREENYRRYFAKLGLEPVMPTDVEVPFSEMKDFLLWLDTQIPDAKEDNDADEEKTLADLEEDYFATEPELVREWVRLNSPILDAVAEAVKDAEVCAFPYTKPESAKNTPFSIVNLFLPGVDDCQWISLGFLFRAQARVADGDIDGAINDRITCIKLGRQIQKGSRCIVEFLTGMKIEERGLSISLTANPDAQPTAEQWERVAEVITNDTRSACFQRTLENWERFLIPSVIQSAEASRVGKRDAFAFMEMSGGALEHLGYDWNYIARWTQEMYHDAILGDGLEEFRETVGNMKRDEKSLCSLFWSRKKRSEFIALHLAGRFFPAIEEVGERIQKMENLEKEQEREIATHKNE